MGSRLVLLPVEDLQQRINDEVKELENSVGVYVSLNKTIEGLKAVFDEAGAKYEKIFFIDCVSSDNVDSEVLYVSPQNLDELLLSIEEFLEEIKGEKFLIIDALSTLLIYNSENEVARFVEKVIECSSKHKTRFIAFSPKTKGEELLNKVFNFFDKVEK
ncbi:hypothetical protein D6829_02430 [Candidatus Pacearchaeota archaeon]|nr:MAG: hypothetical protein D6829_02430 [Candidatus Pacearchaeota archaeon]